MRSFLSALTGVFATPVAENPTGVMVEAAYRELGVDARYLSCDVAPDALGAAVAGAVAMGWRGFNCSLPHKVAVTRLVDELAPSASLIGAVNCVVNDGGRLRGENTDGRGFLESLRTVREPTGLSVLVLGAGGAARAVAVELALAGVRKILVANRSALRAGELARHVAGVAAADVRAVSWDRLDRAASTVDVVVNATSVGLFPDVERVVPLDLAALRRGALVADVVPNPPRTALLRGAGALGFDVLDGLGMLVNQAVLGVRLWTGLDPDPAVMRSALDDVFTAPDGPPAG